MTDIATPVPTPQSTEQQPDQVTANQSKPEKRMLKAKINGREELVSEESLLRDYQKLRSGEERLAAATQKEKQIQSFMQQLETDPEAAFKQTGLSKEKKRALAERWLTEQLEEEMRDPREAELMALKAELDGYKSKEKQTHEEAEREAMEGERMAAIQKRQAHFQETFSKALEMSPLSKDPETAQEALRAMALHYRLAKSQGYEPDPAELAAVVEERQIKTLHAAVSALDGEGLVKLLGKDLIKKLRAYDLAQLTKQPAAPQVADDWQPAEERKSKKSSLDDLRRMARRDR